jgi:hypothetical protein
MSKLFAAKANFWAGAAKLVINQLEKTIEQGAAHASDSALYEEGKKDFLTGHAFYGRAAQKLNAATPLLKTVTVASAGGPKPKA